MALSPKLVRQSMFWLVIAIALYGTAVVLSGVEDIRTMLEQIGVFGWSLLIGLSTLNIALRFVRWQYYLRSALHCIIGRRPHRVCWIYFRGCCKQDQSENGYLQ